MTTSSSPRPPLPLFDRDAAIQKVRLAEDAWNTRDPARVATGYTPGTACGAIARGSSPAGRRSFSSWRGSGPGSWTIDSSRSYGRFTRTGSRSDSPTSGATTVGTGSARTGTRTGSSTGTVSHGSADREHQRSADPRAGSPVSVASRPPSGRSSRSLRSGLVGSNLASLSLR